MGTSVPSVSADTFQAVGSLLPVHSAADRVCAKHGAYQEVTYELAGRPIASPCPRCLHEQDAVRTRARIDSARRDASQSRLEALFKQACVPGHFLDATFDNYQLSADNKVAAEQERAVFACRSFAENFDIVLREGGNLLLVGESGTGKTHLSCAIANHLIRHGHSCLFIEATSIVSRIVATRSFSSEISQEDVLDELASVDLLIIDEVEEIAGEDATAILNKVINTRYGKRRPSPPTIAITNLPVGDLVQKVSTKAIDRLADNHGQKVPFPWKSNRSSPPNSTPPWMTNAGR